MVVNYKPINELTELEITPSPLNQPSNIWAKPNGLPFWTSTRLIFK